MKNKGISLIKLVIIVAVLIILVIGAIFISQNGNNNGNVMNSEKSIYLENEKKVYNGIEAFQYEEVEGGIAINYFKNYDWIEYEKIIVPSQIDGMNVVGIGVCGKDYNAMSSIFGKCEIVIPDTVEYIAEGAFRGAKGLEKLSGGENVSRIYRDAFMLCENLREITFINNVKYIDDSAFSACPNFNYKFESKIVNKNQKLSLDSIVCKYDGDSTNNNFEVNFNQKKSTFNDNYYYILNVDCDEEMDIITRLEFDIQFADNFYLNDIQIAGHSIIELKERLGEPYAEIVESNWDDYFKSYYYNVYYVYKFNEGYILFDSNLSGTNKVEIIRNGYTELNNTLNDFINTYG